jgi:hypothetical protein
MRNLSFSKLRSKGIAAFLLLLIIINALGLSLPAWATTCGLYDCSDVSDFDADVNGWALERTTGATLDWLESKSFGFWLWASTATGVLRASGDFRIQKQVYLEPGNYRILYRAAADQQWNGWGFQNPSLVFKGQTGNTIYALQPVTIDQTFRDIRSEIFTVDNPGPVMIEAFTVETPATVYFDYIWVMNDSGATPTPDLSTFAAPTRTPLSGTATPIPTQATPIPSATPYCVNAPTPTPGPGGFATSTPTPTAGPSPTPGVNFSWSYLDTFSSNLLDWASFGNVYMTNNANHTPINETDLARSAFVAYNQTLSSPAGTFTNALAFNNAATDGFTLPFYVDGWAQTDNLPTGQSAYVEVWAYDEPQSLWYKINQQQISPHNWYPFHITVDVPGGGSGELRAFAFVARRTDDPTSGGIFIDDVYFYGDLDNAQRCDGSYPGGTVVLSEPFNPTGSGGGGGTRLEFPKDKPCPPDLNVPNNFWGPLLANLTLFLDGIFAFSPLHNNLNMAGTVHDLLNSPMVTYLQFMALFFDLRIPFAVIGVIVAINVANSIVALWLRIKEIIPFL